MKYSRHSSHGSVYGMGVQRLNATTISQHDYIDNSFVLDGYVSQGTTVSTVGSAFYLPTLRAKHYAGQHIEADALAVSLTWCSSCHQRDKHRQMLHYRT